MDEKKKELARKKFTPDRGPLTEETRSLLSQKMKEWHAKTRRGVEMGNALARRARKITTIQVASAMCCVANLEKLASLF